MKRCVTKPQAAPRRHRHRPTRRSDAAEVVVPGQLCWEFPEGLQPTAAAVAAEEEETSVPREIGARASGGRS
jgi:hypothetical protein